MLSFVDTTHYRIVFDCLEAEYNAHVDAFGSANASLSEDDFNDLADQLGFVDEQPLIDFEQQLGFPSYRRWYENELEQWFDNGGDPESFPILDLFNDPVTAALRNERGAVMIAGRIHLIDQDGRIWEFCDCQRYEDYIANPGNYENHESDECVQVFKNLYEFNGVYCHSNWRQCWWDNYANRKKVKHTLQFRFPEPPGWTTAHASLHAFRQRNNGKWKRNRLPLQVMVHGIKSEPRECQEDGSPFDRQTGFWPWPTKIRTVRRGWGGEHTFRNEQVRGYYLYSHNYNQANQHLDFLNGCYNCGCTPP